jgi:hypothetical protein
MPTTLARFCRCDKRKREDEESALPQHTNPLPASSVRSVSVVTLLGLTPISQVRYKPHQQIDHQPPEEDVNEHH